MVGGQRACIRVLLLLALGTSAAIARDWAHEMSVGVEARDAGQIAQSIALLEEVAARARDPQLRSLALLELGVSLERAERFDDARRVLQSAATGSSGSGRARVALALGNLALQTHDRDAAERYYRQVIDDETASSEARLDAAVNLERVRPEGERLAALERLELELQSWPESRSRTAASLAIGRMAVDLLPPPPANPVPRPTGPGGSLSTATTTLERAVKLAYDMLETARRGAAARGDPGQVAEALEGLGALYESQGRFAEALDLGTQEAATLARLPLGRAEPMRVRLDWRDARLERALSRPADALASYLRAADDLAALRQDLPLASADGRSTYQSLIRPILVSLADLSLEHLDALDARQQQARLATAVQAIEVNHQAELQDYLGDRCSLESLRAAAEWAVPERTAILYAIVLPDRVELIARTRTALSHHATPVSAAAVEDTVREMRASVLDPSSTNLKPAGSLYGLLVEPFEPIFSRLQIESLIVIPDGYLRLVPFAALYDGRRFLAQRFALSTTTALAITELSAPRPAKPRALFAGLSSPGPVADRLASMGFSVGGELAANNITRGISPPAERADLPESSTRQGARLRRALALPGVGKEVADLSGIAGGRSLLDAQFTVTRFQQELQAGRYDRVHVASHGFFGEDAQQSFLLAYDNVIRLGDLQSLIARSGDAQPIDLLTLSACDTATGGERAPLGFAGAAIKAHARSVVATLWPVSDAATQRFMDTLYSELRHTSKAAALTAAQRDLMRSTEYAHPFYWAPFVLTGDWN